MRRLVRGALSVAVAGLWFATAGVSAVFSQEATLDMGAPLPVDPRVTVGTLPNGLRYYIRENRKPEDRAELRLVVNAGSILEDPDQLGLAHFIEHMGFNGTRRFEKQELVNFLESIGMRFGPSINAYTSFDETVYMLFVPTDSAELLARGFDVLEDWAWGMTLDSVEIDKERGVVIEEWRSGRGANARLMDKQFPVLFRGSKYAARLPIGKKETLESFPHHVLKRFYADWYRPDLMAVVAVGDFDARHVERLIQERFARIPAAAQARPRGLEAVPDHEETLYAIATDPEASHLRVSVYYKQPLREGPTVGDYRQKLVESLYHSMFNDRLRELLLRPDPPFINAGADQGRLVRGAEVYMLDAVVPEGGIERGLEALLTEAERVDRHGFTATELERAKTELLRFMERAYAERENTESGQHAGEYVRAFLQGEPIPGIEREYELAQRLVPGIRLEEVNRLAREWITEENRVVLVSAPEKEGLKPPTEAELAAVFAAVEQKAIDPYVDVVASSSLVPVPPEPGAVVEERTIPGVDVLEWRLANGVRVLLKPTDFKADEVVFTAYSPGGHSLVPDSNYISAIYAPTVVSLGGLGDFDVVALQKALTGKMVSVQPYLAETLEGVSGGGSPRDIETLFQLIYLTFTAPREDSGAFAAYRERVLGILENRAASPEVAFSDTLAVTLRQHHFRARPITREVLGELELGTAMRVYRDRFSDAGDFTFAFVGSFDPAAIRPLVERYLGGLPARGRKETWRDVGIDPPKGTVQRVVRRGLEPKSLTGIVFAGDFGFEPEERLALSALGQVMNIRLRELLREDLGGTYGVGVSVSAERDPDAEYSIAIHFGTAPDRVEELTGVVFEEIERLKTEGPPAEVVQKVREAERRSWETNMKENRYWLNQLVAADRYGLPYDRILTYPQRIETITVGMVRDAAKRYLDTANYVKVTLFPETPAAVVP